MDSGAREEITELMEASYMAIQDTTGIEKPGFFSCVKKHLSLFFFR